MFTLMQAKQVLRFGLLTCLGLIAFLYNNCERSSGYFGKSLGYVFQIVCYVIGLP